MGLLNRSSAFFRVLYTKNTASPIAVHLLMIFGVALYTVLGAVVMQKLESPSAVQSQMRSEQRTARSLEASQSKSEAEHFSLTDVQLHNAKRPVASKDQSRQIIRNRKCVTKALRHFSQLNCSKTYLKKTTMKAIDKCYHTVLDNQPLLQNIVFKHSSSGIQLLRPQAEFIEPWSFTDSVLFTFTVITTIGYGNVAPRTFGGRLFCICYGLVGVPFALLAIADLGKFLSEILNGWEKAYHKLYRQIEKRWIHYKNTGSFVFKPAKLDSHGRLLMDENTNNTSSITDKDISLAEKGSLYRPEDSIEPMDKHSVSIRKSHTLSDKASTIDEEEDESSNQTISLLLMFIVYIFGGSFLLSIYEPDMTFFKALYFNFVSLTSIGLGDVVPQSESYMVITLLYIAVGLALTTIAIEIFADTLKKLHYFGRKIENVGNVVIWFGGKSLTMKALVKNLGDQFNLPVNTISSLNLDTFVDNAIKVEAGELETLRAPPIVPEDLELDLVNFADEEEEIWIPQKTPTPRDPTPEPEPDPVPPTPTSTCVEPTPIPSPEPETAREPTPPLPETAREPTPDTSSWEEDKRKAYSEEAWRRYQEYQKQWSKFRQTKTSAAARAASITAAVAGPSQAGSPRSRQGSRLLSISSDAPAPFISGNPGGRPKTKKRNF